MVVGRVVVFAALVGYGWWATGLRPFSAIATIAVVGSGVCAMAWGAAHRRPAAAPPVQRGIGVWFVLFATLAAWQLAAYVQHPRSDHPTLSSLTNAVLDAHAAQALACAAWLVIAVRLAER